MNKQPLEKDRQSQFKRLKYVDGKKFLQTVMDLLELKSMSVPERLGRQV